MMFIDFLLLTHADPGSGVWHLIVSFPGLCGVSYFVRFIQNFHLLICKYNLANANLK